MAKRGGNGKQEEKEATEEVEEEKKEKDEVEEEEEEGGSAEDEKNAVCVHGSGGSDVCESRVRLAPIVVSVASTGTGQRAPGLGGPGCVCGLCRAPCRLKGPCGTRCLASFSR